MTAVRGAQAIWIDKPRRLLVCLGRSRADSVLRPASDRVLSVPNKRPTLGAAKDLRFLCHMRLLLRTGGGLWGRH